MSNIRIVAKVYRESNKATLEKYKQQTKRVLSLQKLAQRSRYKVQAKLNHNAWSESTLPSICPACYSKVKVTVSHRMSCSLTVAHVLYLKEALSIREYLSGFTKYKSHKK